MKVLVTRTDRLGDLVLSLPVFGLLAAADPSVEVHVMVAPASTPLVANDNRLQRVWTWHDGLSPTERRQLQDEIAAENFDAVIMLQYRRALAWLLRRAGVRRRYGPWSQWSSWLLLNRGLRQNRSGGTRHESEFNVQLVQRWLADRGMATADVAISAPQLTLNDEQRRLGQRFRAEEALGASKIVFVHPGSGGSALDWEPMRYAAVANALAKLDGVRVFVTGSGSDSAIVTTVANLLEPAVTTLLDRYELAEFLAVVATGDLMIGPSTGPLHLAAALSVPTLGLFPPVRTMHPDRWGPRGPMLSVSGHILPEVDCPAQRNCRQERCVHYSCMDRIEAGAVVARAQSILGEGVA